MVSKRNPKQEARAAAEKALAAAAKKQAAAEAKAAAQAKKAQRKAAEAAKKQPDPEKPSSPVAPAPPSPAAASAPRARSSAASKAAAAEEARPSSAKRGDATSKAATSKAKKRRRWPLRVVLAVVALALVVAGVFAWGRWLRYDDEADFQGAWFVANSAKEVDIDSSTIKLTDDVKFSYKLDPFAKTIAFSFGATSNTGRYRFSADRKQLVVTEGSSYTALSTLLEDIALDWQDLTRAVQGEQPLQPKATSNITVFTREPSGQALPTKTPSATPPDSAPDDSPTTDGPSFKEPVPTPEPGQNANG